jgi:anaerobic ribonucleoside-triphosphate reductase activating protein
VDGEFHIEEKNLMLRFRGSANQRIIDVPGTLETYENGPGKIVLSKYMEK